MRKPRNRKPRPKYYAFAYTNHKFHSIFTELSKLTRKCIYAVVGLEKCPTTNKYHVQGYFFLKEPLTLGKARLLLGSAHIEPARECPAINFMYCTKSKHYESIGSISLASKLWQVYNTIQPPFDS